MANKPLRISPGLSYSITVVGARRAGMGDIYHALLGMPWWKAITVIVSGYLVLNLLFAGLYCAVGGVAGADPGSFVDAFFFSVQTFGTIGYGEMHPVTRAANAVVVVESIMSLLATAVATGLVFVRFSLTKGRIVFGRKIAVGPMDGVPTLMIRLGNDRSNQIYDAQMRLMYMKTSVSAEGVKLYRSLELPLVRDRAPALARSWTILHRIDEKSPLAGETPESMRASEAEITVTVSGVDDTSLQSVHARFTYEHFSIEWGTRLADIIADLPDGNLVLDLRQFHELVPTAPTPTFPYPRPPAAR